MQKPRSYCIDFRFYVSISIFYFVLFLWRTKYLSTDSVSYTWNMSDIISNFRIVVMFVTADLTVFRIRHVGMVMTYLCPQFHILSTTGWLATANKPDAQQNFHAAGTTLFYTYENITFIKVAYFPYFYNQYNLTAKGCNTCLKNSNVGHVVITD
jgi:hypothetical protein